MRQKALFGGALALLLLAGCSSTGDIFGGRSQNTAQLRGTVASVDLNGRSILLTSVSGYDSALSNSGGNRARVYFDARTTVQYQGRSYRPEDLERGDEVDVNVDQSANRLVANSMVVVYDASGGTRSSYPSGGSNDPNGSYRTTLRGTVRYVDTSRGTILVDRDDSSADPVTIDYDANNTTVRFNGQSYRPTDLQRGDEVDMSLMNTGNGRLMAQAITVLRSVSSGTGGSAQSTSTVRGTVRYVDGSRGTITLDQATWMTGFIAGSGNTITVQYDANARVDSKGQLYPVTNLEPGDVVEVQVQTLGNARYLAQRLTLVRDVHSRY